LPRLTWLLIVLLVIWFLPVFVERVEFALVRGKERAEAEVAGKQLPTEYLKELSRAFTLLPKRIGPSVVHVETARILEGSGQTDELFALFGRQQMLERGEGSGVIVDASGYILTNNHVVDHAGQIEVSLSDGRSVAAEVVGTDPATDLAVLKIDASDLIVAEWGNSDELDVGAMVWAVGNPFGLDRSITFGIVSAKNRRGFEHNPYQDFLQTDAAVNPGNSGGPLVNISGQIVGINTAIIGKAYQGISFAIPSSTAHEVYEKLKSTGKVARGWLGVGLSDVPPEVARKLNLPSLKGALVQEIRPGGPADKGGLQVGDFIVEWNGQPVDNSGSLGLLVAKTPIGSKAKVVLYREGKKMTLEVPIEERPQQMNR
jgi:Do/DeqQ family serine protease